MKYKYAVHTNKGKQRGEPRSGRCVDPESWVTGPDPLTHEKYYAFLKHRAQAKFRNEDYCLTWDDWQELWDDETYLKRGRSADSLCLSRLDFESGWTRCNVHVISRREHLSVKRKVEYIRNGR